MQAVVNTINFGTESRLDLKNIRDIKASSAFCDPVTLARKILGISFVKSLKLLNSAQGYILITPIQEEDGSGDEEAFIKAHYDRVPERTHEDFQEGYKARMSRVKDRLHEYVDIDLPVVEDEENW